MLSNSLIQTMRSRRSANNYTMDTMNVIQYVIHAKTLKVCQTSPSLNNSHYGFELNRNKTIDKLNS